MTGLRVEAHFSQARQIDERQVQNVWAVNPERYRQLANAFVLPSHSESLLLDLLANVLKVGEFFVYVEELGPFSKCWAAGRRVAGFGGVYQLEDKGPARNDALATGKKVPSNDAVLCEQVDA